jgi:fumarylpyruvate hydrolase
MKLVFPAHEAVTLPVIGTDARFPLHRIYCVGRNYNDHVKEMGGVVGRDPPFFFSKPNDAVALNGTFPYPAMSHDVHHEVELVVALGHHAQIFGYATGIDFTRRDVQAESKKLSRPWETAKSFDYSAPISPIIPMASVLERGLISLDVNGQRRQSGDIADMIWSVPEIIESLSKYFILRAGDIIFTGTPAGVGAVQKGDALHANIEGVGSLDVLVT